MSTKNTVPDLDVRIQGLSNRPFWLLSEHIGYYVYLDSAQLNSNAKHKLAGKVKLNWMDRLNISAQHTVSKRREVFPISLHAFVGPCLYSGIKL